MDMYILLVDLQDELKSWFCIIWQQVSCFGCGGCFLFVCLLVLYGNSLFNAVFYNSANLIIRLYKISPDTLKGSF